VQQQASCVNPASEVLVLSCCVQLHLCRRRLALPAPISTCFLSFLALFEGGVCHITCAVSSSWARGWFLCTSCLLSCYGWVFLARHLYPHVCRCRVLECHLGRYPHVMVACPCCLWAQRVGGCLHRAVCMCQHVARCQGHNSLAASTMCVVCSKAVLQQRGMKASALCISPLL
jgi:hypothetical protein